MWEDQKKKRVVAILWQGIELIEYHVQVVPEASNLINLQGICYLFWWWQFGGAAILKRETRLTKTRILKGFYNLHIQLYSTGRSLHSA